MGVRYFGETFPAGVFNAPVNERQVARYIHTANDVLNIASLDITTGIFTTSNPIIGTYSVGKIITMIVNYKNAIPAKLFAEWNGTNEYGLEYIDSTHFYVVNKSSSNTRITTYAANTVDLSQIVFEYNSSNNGGNLPNVSIDLSGITLGSYIRTVWTGVRNRPSYSRVDINGTYGDANTVFNNTAGISMLDGRHFMIGYAEQIYHYIQESGLLLVLEGRSANQQWSGGTSWALASGTGAARAFWIVPKWKPTLAAFQGNMANGSTLEIYTTI
ncbi:hypothetical protein ACT8ZR_09320 [Neobacillus sp. M.A.Huq-85]